MRSGRITRDGHCVSEDGSAPVTKAHPPDRYATHKKGKETVVERVYRDEDNLSLKEICNIWRDAA